jgi:hypothetical protein
MALARNFKTDNYFSCITAGPSTHVCTADARDKWSVSVSLFYIVPLLFYPNRVTAWILALFLISGDEIRKDR